MRNAKKRLQWFIKSRETDEKNSLQQLLKVKKVKHTNSVRNDNQKIQGVIQDEKEIIKILSIFLNFH